MRSQDAAGKGRATLADVARRAGVSASTASLAFSGSGPVSPATRAKVLSAAQELGYAGPDPVARSLRRGRSGVVAVLVSEPLRYAFRDPVMIRVLDGLSEELSTLGASLLLVAGDSDRRPPDAARVAGVPMDAAVLADCGQLPPELVASLLRRGVPVVAIDDPGQAAVPVVDIDDEGASAALVRHLVELGHRQIGVVTLPLRADGRRGPVHAWRLADPRVGSVVRRRISGVVTTAPPSATVLLVEAAANDAAEGELAAGELLDRPDPPTALIAQSDVVAVGCLRAAARRELSVPEQLSVCGFDGVDLHLLGAVELTTVEQPAADKGRAAGRQVAALLRGERPDDVRLPVRLRIGTTTGPVPT